MKKKLSTLAGKILALGCNPKSEEKKEKRKVQAGIFLSESLQEKESAEPGFHYRWSLGPTSPELSAVWNELRSHIKLFNLREIDPPHRQKHCLRVCPSIHIGPERKLVKQGLWARGLSALAELQNGDWTEEKMRKQIRGSFGPKVGAYYDEMKITLQRLKNKNYD